MWGRSILHNMPVILSFGLNVSQNPIAICKITIIHNFASCAGGLYCKPQECALPHHRGTGGPWAIPQCSSMHVLLL